MTEQQTSRAVDVLPADRPPLRDRLSGRFLPGSGSNNGGGIKSGIAQRVREMTGDCTIVVDYVISVLLDQTEHTRFRLQAAELLLAYGYGKPEVTSRIGNIDGEPTLRIVIAPARVIEMTRQE